jgi:hypothetical protein
MPVSDRDIYATAKLVIDRHGKSATYYACSRADELLDLATSKERQPGGASRKQPSSCWRTVSQTGSRRIDRAMPVATGALNRHFRLVPFVFDPFR